MIAKRLITKRSHGLCVITIMFLLGVGMGQRQYLDIETSFESNGYKVSSDTIQSCKIPAAPRLYSQLLSSAEASRPTESTPRQLKVLFLRHIAFSSAVQTQAGSETKNSHDEYHDKLQNVIALWKSGKARDAAQAVAELVKAYPDRWEGYAIAGVIEEGVNNDSAAKTVYEHALFLAPEADKPRIREAIQHLESKSKIMAVCQRDRPITTTDPPCAVPPTLLRTLPETSPDAGGKHQIEGSVRLQIVVGEDGSTRDCRVIKPSSPELDSAAVSAATQWKFKPASYQGKPVAVEIELDVSLWLDARMISTLPNAQPASPSEGKQVRADPRK